MAPASANGKALILYGTSACHLCELAEALLAGLYAQGQVPAFEEVDISEDDDLFERYGERIPVLRDPTGRELGWPFDAPAVLGWLAD